MIADGKPVHWPAMLAVPESAQTEQGAIRALAEVRRLIVAYRKSDVPEDLDWRVHHARTDYIVNVVAGLIADAKAIDAFNDSTTRETEPLRDRIKALEEKLAESKRPFTAQMRMQNNRIIGLTAEVDRLTTELRRVRTPDDKGNK